MTLRLGQRVIKITRKKLVCGWIFFVNLRTWSCRVTSVLPWIIVLVTGFLASIQLRVRVFKAATTTCLAAIIFYRGSLNWAVVTSGIQIQYSTGIWTKSLSPKILNYGACQPDMQECCQILAAPKALSWIVWYIFRDAGRDEVPVVLFCMPLPSYFCKNSHATFDDLTNSNWFWNDFNLPNENHKSC